MDMRSGGGAGHSISESNKWYSCLAQVTQQALSFATVRMKRHVDGMAVIKAQAVMGGGLAKRADRQSAAECPGKKILDFPGIDQ
jgi:hypothetical protein